MSARRVQLICDLGLQEQTLRMVDLTTEATSDIAMERVLQDNQWGGPETDDLRTDAEWAEYIHKQVSKLFQDEGGALAARDRYVKIASLAVAAIQSIDRKNPQPCDCANCQLRRALESGEGGVHVIEVRNPTELAALLSGLGARLGGRPR